MDRRNIGLKNGLLPILIAIESNMIGKEPIMLSIPSAAEPILLQFSIAFTEPTFQRIVLLATGAILAIGRRTITAILWTMRGLVAGHPSSYHRVFSRAVWSLWPLGKVLATAILRHIPTDEPILVPMDDTTAEHRGKRVYGKGCHYDAVRSSGHSQVVFRWGHRWVVLAISVKFGFSSRRWALPVLAALYRPEQLNHTEARRHKTPAHLARQLMAVLIHWFPERKFVFLGDGGFASHELARFCHRHQRHATLISRFHGDANLYAPPPKRKNQKGRPRIKGHKLPTPQEVVASGQLTPATISWHGGTDRRVELISETGHWYRAGKGTVPIRWVFVHHVEGTHQDEYLYTTDSGLSAEQIAGWFTTRWPVETTFQEIREHLGFETPQQYVAKSVLRTAPCLLGLFSVVCLIFAEHTRSGRIQVRRTQWYIKAEPTFSDAMAAVRRLFWQETIFENAPYHKVFKKLPPKLSNMLLDYLSQAA